MTAKTIKKDNAQEVAMERQNRHSRWCHLLRYPLTAQTSTL